MKLGVTVLITDRVYEKKKYNIQRTFYTGKLETEQDIYITNMYLVIQLQNLSTHNQQNYT